MRSPANNSLIGLDSAQAEVTGGGNGIVCAGTGDVAALSGTNGTWDWVAGSNSTIDLDGAQSVVAGDTNTLGLHNSIASLTGNSETFVFQQDFGWDVIGGFNTTDKVQLAAADFADWSALLGHVTQSGSNTVITLGAANSITLAGVTMSSLQQSQFSIN